MESKRRPPPTVYEVQSKPDVMVIAKRLMAEHGYSESRTRVALQELDNLSFVDAMCVLEVDFYDVAKLRIK